MKVRRRVRAVRTLAFERCRVEVLRLGRAGPRWQRRRAQVGVWLPGYLNAIPQKRNCAACC